MNESMHKARVGYTRTDRLLCMSAPRLVRVIFAILLGIAFILILKHILRMFSLRLSAYLYTYGIWNRFNALLMSNTQNDFPILDAHDPLRGPVLRTATAAGLPRPGSESGGWSGSDPGDIQRSGGISYKNELNLFRHAPNHTLDLKHVGFFNNPLNVLLDSVNLQKTFYRFKVAKVSTF